MRRKHNFQKDSNDLKENHISLTDLPKDLLNEIATKLFAADGRNGIIALSQTNLRLYSICSQDQFWKYEYNEKNNRIKLYHNDGVNSTSSAQVPNAFAIYNHPSRIKQILAGTRKSQLLQIRNQQIQAKLTQLKKEIYLDFMPTLVPPIHDTIAMSCLIFGQFLWIVNNFVPINSFFVFFPLFISLCLFELGIISALIIDWAVRVPYDLHRYAYTDKYSLFFTSACRALMRSRGHKQTNTPGQLRVVFSL